MDGKIGTFFYFIKQQLKEFEKGGYPLFLRRCRTLLLILLASFGVLIVRLLRPFVVIRFATLVSSRIGHFAANTEIYLCERDAGMHNPRSIDIFYLTLPICNQQLKRMWVRNLHIFNFVMWIDRLNRCIPGGKIHQIPLPNDQDMHNFLAVTPAHLAFTAEEERLGLEAMHRLGVADGASFICFYARDSAYLATNFPSEDWHRHNYRDSNIHNYIPAIKELVGRGHFAVRMGAVVKEALKVTDPRIIDYATNGRCDFLDVYLSAKCRFFIASTGGINAVPRIFRRPIVYVNFIPLGIEHLTVCTPRSLFIPKKLWLKTEGRLLSLREIFAMQADKFFLTREYDQKGIEVIENTPEEITAVAIEMEERLKGAWQSNEEDEKLQHCFWSFLKPSNLQGLIRIGTEFLHQNQELLK